MALPAMWAKEVAAFTLLRQGTDVALTCEIVDENRFDDRAMEHKHRWEMAFPRPPDKQAGGCNVKIEN